MRFQGGFGLGHGGELGFPPLFEAAGNEPVFWFAQVEGTLGAGGLIAGPFGPQLEGPQGAGFTLVKLISSGQRQRDLLWCDGRKQPDLGYRVHQRGADGAAAGGVGFIEPGAAPVMGCSRTGIRHAHGRAAVPA